MPLSHKQRVALLSIAFILLRAVSLFTWQTPLLNACIGALLVGSFVYIAWRNTATAWLFLVAELMLGGSGHFFDVFGLLLRTWLLGIFAISWLAKGGIKKTLRALKKKDITTFGVYAGLIAFASAIGFFSGNGLKLVLQDAILYGFLFLSFPAMEYKTLTEKQFPHIAKAFLIGSAVFSAITFWFYALGFGVLQDTYYDWYRNIGAGKITDLGNNFFRIVVSDHLLIIPAIIIIGALLIQQRKKPYLWIYGALASFTLALNFTRIYFVALAVGFLVLFTKKQWKRWFFVSASMASLVLGSFFITSALASGGNTIGLEQLGLRISGVTAPTTDVSGAIRLAILPNAIDLIKERPFFGSGLGTEISFTHPVTDKIETRTQFDWGYHEQLAELGAIGFTIFLAVLFIFFFGLWRKIKTAPNDAVLKGLFASGIALFAINITTPALFQGFGLLLIATIAVFSHADRAA